MNFSLYLHILLVYKLSNIYITLSTYFIISQSKVVKPMTQNCFFLFLETTTLSDYSSRQNDEVFNQSLGPQMSPEDHKTLHLILLISQFLHITGYSIPASIGPLT